MGDHFYLPVKACWELKRRDFAINLRYAMGKY